MKLRSLGNSELQISPVILGTWALGGWLWGGTEKNKPRETVIASLDAGINCIDTAPVYGFGLSEEVIGDAIKGNRDKLIIATKCGLVWDGRKGSTLFFKTKDTSGRELAISTCLRKRSILNECDQSLKLLGIDEIDLYQCHWPDPGTPVDETIEALIELKERGKILEFGVSNFSTEQVDEMVKKGAAPVSNQLKYSFLSRETAKNDIPYCIENNIGVICYSPMEMGLLAGKIGMDTVFPENDTRCGRPWFEPENRQKVLAALDSLQPLADKYDATLAQLIIASTIELPGITGAIAGARTPDQAGNNAKAGILELEKKDIYLVIETFKPLKLEKPFDPATTKR